MQTHEVAPASQAAVDVKEAIRAVRARYAETTPEQRQQGADRASRWLQSLTGSTGGRKGASEDAAPRL